MRYRFLDFTLDSDIPLPELELDPSREPTLVLRYRVPAPRASNHALSASSSASGAHSWPAVIRSREGYTLAFGDRLSFLYSPGRVEWTCSEGVTHESVRHALLDQALPLIAAHEDRVVIHAACAIQHRRAVLFAGPAGEGKSTLVAHLLANGWQYAADDAVALCVRDETVFARPSYSGVRLWPDTAEALGLAGAESSTLPSGKHRFGARPIPDGDLVVQAVYCIASANADALPDVQELSARDGLIALVQNSYVLDPVDRERAATQFDTLATVAGRVTVRSLVVPHDFRLLDDVRARIERDLPVMA